MHRDEIATECQKCDNMWTVAGYIERGTFQAIEPKDYICPECGHNTEE
jgi:hypothetical protein